MDPIRYLRRVVIAALNHRTVSYTEASHSGGGFIIHHRNWLRPDCRGSVWERFMANVKSSVNLSR